MKVLLVEPFYGGSHQRWAETLNAFSRHEWHFLTLEGRFWKWRFRGASILLGQKWKELKEKPDLIVASSMLDLPTFMAVLAKAEGELPPIVLYCHENQFLYPLPDDRPVFKEQRTHFGAINWRSSLLADRVFYNSEFHRQAAIEAYEDFIQRAPDHREESLLNGSSERSSVYPPAPDLQALDRKDLEFREPSDGEILLLWNHRWEQEKDPEAFVEFVDRAVAEGVNIRLILAGPSGSEEKRRQELLERYPEKTLLAEAIDDPERYVKWLHAADLIISFAHQDFFGLSVVEAMYCRTAPLLPDRLAYKEHLTEDLKGMLYKDLKEALQILHKNQGKELEAKQEAARASVAPYDIRNWIEDFDKELEAVRGDRPT